MKIYQVDAFTDTLFGGNPAAVIPLTEWPADELLQRIAAENNLSETAFLVPDDTADFRLRWFTPTTEVDLCGHATLAAAWVAFHRLGHHGNDVRFASDGGELRVRQQDGRLLMDFPARPGTPVAAMPGLFEALGIGAAREVLQSRDTLVILEDEDQVRFLMPDFAALARLDTFAVMVSAPGHHCDFVSRFFAPARGVAEDPVTGSAHCTLVPYWSRRLGKPDLHARQLSTRGGELFCHDRGERVDIAGDAVCYLEGEVHLLEDQEFVCAGGPA